MPWVLPFYRNKSKSCLYLNEACGNNNEWVESTLFIQQPTSATMEMSPTNKASNAITSATTATQNIYKIKSKRNVFNTHKWQQAPKQVTSTQAPKWQWYRKISVPRTNTRHNEHHNSNHDIYEIKTRTSKTIFTTHKRPQEAITNKHNGTRRSDCQEPTQGIMIIKQEINDFIKKYIVSIILLLYTIASMALFCLIDFRLEIVKLY